MESPKEGRREVAPNAVDRGSMRGGPPKAVSTGIACLPGRDGFGCPSGIIDYETGVVLAHVASDSMEGRLVLDTHDQPKGASLPPDAWSRSGRGAHCTARSPHERPAGSRPVDVAEGVLLGRAPMESSWGQDGKRVGDTSALTHEQISALVDDCIDCYDSGRGQARLGWLTPMGCAASPVA